MTSAPKQNDTLNPQLPTRVQDHMYRSFSADNTQAFGALVASLVEANDVISLSGDLGAGKTEFTKGFARELGVVEPVTSPTFAIMAYHSSGRLELYHFDLYRIEDVDALYDIDLTGALEADGVCVIEWGNLFADELGGEYLDIVLLVDEVDGSSAFDAPSRTMRVTAHGTRATQLLNDIEAAVAGVEAR